MAKTVVPTQLIRSVNSGRVEAVRVVTMMDNKASFAHGVGNKADDQSLTQAMVGMLLPKQKGIELVVRLESGADVTVVQAADVMFRPGDRVRVMQSHDGAIRVTY